MKRMSADGRPERIMFGVLLGMEGVALAGLVLGWPLLGDYYTPSDTLQLAASLFIALLTLSVWYWIVKRAARPGRAAESMSFRPPLRIRRDVVWFVVVVNVVATIGFGYGAVGYTGVPFAFLITMVPLEPLLVAFFCQRRRLDPALLGMYAVLGLLRGWTGHLLLIFFLVIFLIDRRRRLTFVVLSLAIIVVVFEPLMAIRAMIRGFDDGTTSLVYRLASRLAITPMTDYIFQNVGALAVCNDQTIMPWWAELLGSIVPRAWLGMGVSTSINQCLAMYASGDPQTQLTFSTTLIPKLLFVFLNEGIVGGLSLLAAVVVLIAWQLRTARQYLGSAGYVYLAIFLYFFFVSGVLRDLMMPTYFLVLLVVVRFAVSRRHRELRVPASKADLTDMKASVDLIEPCKSGIEHASFNEGAAHALARASGEKLRFWAAPSHLSGVRLGASAEPRPIRVLSDGGKLHMVRKAWTELRSLRRVLSVTEREGRALCVLSLTPLVFWMISFFRIWRRARACVMVHNELEKTLDEKGRRAFSRGWFVASAIKRWPSDGPAIVCLTRAGCDHMKSWRPDLPIFYASHPFVDVDKPVLAEMAEAAADLHYDWAIAGTLRDARSNALLRAFVESMDQAIGTGAQASRRRLLIVGGRALEAATLRVLPSAKMLEVTCVRPPSSASYFQALRQCRALVFLCTPDMYRVSASGVLVDGLSAGLPIYSLPCVYAEELANDYPGRVAVEPDLHQLAQSLLGESLAPPPTRLPQLREVADLGAVVLAALSKGAQS